MPKLSIIVPVYNAEHILETCLRSILGQTLSDLEVICVNDGSTDRSLEILERFNSDPRIKVLSQTNAGPSVARNAGRAIAKGEFISFVDADDYLHPQYAEILVNALQRHPTVGCALLNQKGIAPGDHPEIPTYPSEIRTTLYSDLFNDFLDHESLHIEVGRFFYRRSAIEGLPFLPGLLFEDVYFTPLMFRKIHEGVKIDVPLYYYIQWPTSRSHTNFSQASLFHFYWVMHRLDQTYADEPKQRRRLRREYYPAYFVLCWKRLQQAKQNSRTAEWRTLRRTLLALSRGFIVESPMTLRKWPLRWRLRFLYARLWAALHPSFRKACETTAQSILKQEVQP